LAYTHSKAFGICRCLNYTYAVQCEPLAFLLPPFRWNRFRNSILTDTPTYEFLDRYQLVTHHFVHKIRSVSLVVLFLAASAFASATGSDIDEVTVLGSRLPGPALQSVEVIDADEIFDRQPLTVIDLLRSIPGVTGIEPGGAGGVTELYIRGADANFTTVFVDGIRLNDLTDSRGGAFDFSSLFPGEIERVELVRGPFSALYGSGALSGAINIQTTPIESDQMGGRAQASIGGDGYWTAGVKLSGPAGSGNFSASVNHADFGNEPSGSARTVSSISTSFVAPISEHLSVDLTARLSERDRTSFPVASGGPRLSPFALFETGAADERSFGATFSWRREGASASAVVSWLGREEVVASPAVPDGVFSGQPASTSDTDFDRLTVLVSTQFSLSKRADWGAGFEFSDENGRSIGVLEFGGFPLPKNFARSRSTISPFVEGRVDVATGITFFGGFRYDDTSDVGGAASPRAGLSYEHDRYDLKATVAWGKGRKAASFFALGDPLVGNELLEPEDSEGVDFEIEFQLGKGWPTLELSGYRYEYSNLIDFDFSLFQLVNRGRVDTKGAELRISDVDGQSLDWAVFIATHRNEVDGTNNALLHRPNTTAGADITWQIGRRWSVYTGVKYEGDRLSSSVPGGFESLPSVVRLDTTLTQHLSDELDVQFAIYNVTDKYYEAVAGIPSTGRQFRLLLRQQF